MNSFGSYLKAKREEKNIRLEEIASITKIHLHTLQLLETDQWAKLPPEPFLRGFIVAYGKYVGLQAGELLETYARLVLNKDQAEPSGSPNTVKVQTREMADDVIVNGASFPVKKVAVVATVVVAVTLLIGIIYLGKRMTIAEKEERAAKITPIPKAVSPPTSQIASVPTEKKNAVLADVKVNPKEAVLIPSVPLKMEPPKLEARAKVQEEPTDDEEETSRPAPPTSAATVPQKAAAQVVTQPATEAATGPFTHEVAIEGKERTWIKVVIDDQPPVEYFLPEGAKASYKAKEKIKVVLGNSTGSKVIHNGKAEDGVKFMGTIRYYKFPFNAKFPQDLATKKTASPHPASEEP